MLGDFGNIYGERGNGYEYGWLSDACIHAVKRDMYIDTIYDTFINLQNDSIWEIQLLSLNTSYDLRPNDY